MRRVFWLSKLANAPALLAVSIVAWAAGMNSENPIAHWCLMLVVSPALVVAAFATAFLVIRLWRADNRQQASTDGRTLHGR